MPGQELKQLQLNLASLGLRGMGVVRLRYGGHNPKFLWRLKIALTCSSQLAET